MAIQRIIRLIDLAERCFKKYPDYSKRYIFLARRIGMRHRVRIPTEYKRRICKGCGAWLVPGANCRIRIRSSRVVTTCLECGRSLRIPY